VASDSFDPVPILSHNSSVNRQPAGARGWAHTRTSVRDDARVYPLDLAATIGTAIVFKPWLLNSPGCSIDMKHGRSSRPLSLWSSGRFVGEVCEYKSDPRDAETLMGQAPDQRCIVRRFFASMPARAERHPAQVVWEREENPL